MNTKPYNHLKIDDGAFELDYIEKASELRLSRSIIAHLQVDGNSMDRQQQRELQQRLNTRAARIAVSRATNRAQKQRQTQLDFPRRT